MWPPDLFAVVATALDEFDGMSRTALAQTERANGGAWRTRVRAIAKAWQELLEASPLPDQWELGGDTWLALLAMDGPGASLSLGGAWQAFVDMLTDAPEGDGGWSSAQFLLAVADEASRSLCSEANSSAHELMMARLMEWDQASIATLPPRLARVLPKHHTPETGFTLRSLSQFLALVPFGGVSARWAHPASDAQVNDWNVLILPWPFQLLRSQFVPDERTDSHGYFRLDRAADQGRVVDVVLGALREAKLSCRRVDMIVLPELALTTGNADKLLEQDEVQDVYVVAGVQIGEGERWQELDGPANVALIYDGPSRVLRVQAKHHRWRIDQSQVAMYGLHGALDLTRNWWEDIRIHPRALEIVQARTNLSLVAMICEDLARQEPVAELLRSIGPNLVIALLMDGPQLPGRWGSRYATVLAEDPGSSVLVLTSLGMSRLTREHARSQGWKDEHATIALWRDPVAGERKISLDPDEVGAVLHLRMVRRTETTADGRVEADKAWSPTLAGWTAVRAPAI